MPAGRRSIGKPGVGRTLPAPGAAFSEDYLKSKSPISSVHEPLPMKITTMKHIALPPIPQEGAIAFELFMFVFTMMATYLQFLHLYRSVWWLPQSYTRYAMNFYLIDPYLVAFIVTILGRRVVYLVLCQILTKVTPPSIWPALHKLLVFGLLFAILSVLVYCALNIMKHHPIVNIFYLCYPISIYFILFGMTVVPFFDVSSLPSIGNDSRRARVVLGKPSHTCSVSPLLIRREVEFLKSDFNLRMKQVLFSSVLSAYYAGFVPCCFAQNALYYDTYWATQHLALVWLALFTMQGAFCYPPSYCDILHRAALHLGRWVKVYGRNQHIPTHLWDDTTLWSQGALVRFSKDFYKAEGITTAAVPGNSMHNRFYVLFCDPTVLVFFLLGLQTSLILIQLGSLARASEWYQVISVTIHLFINYYMLFRLARDFFICLRVYTTEHDIQEKLTG